MTCPELRITDVEVALCPRRDVTCPHCKGRGHCYHWFDGEPEPEWCCDCGGPGGWSAPALLSGASARLGAVLVARLPHLRHATWPPKHERLNRAALAWMLGAAIAGGVR